ncbi:MAG TPA: hypothetical protein VE326_07175 [Candidatus Binatia bacterium]|nr:hypothetical protein [Candidatus Binatia bacterium]
MGESAKADRVVSTPRRAPESRWWRAAPLAIVALALAVRLTLLLAYPRPLASDARDYDALAWTLATTGHYDGAGGAPTAYRAPGYPAFVAGIYAAGRHPEAVKAAQAALDALTALLLYALLSRRSRTAALVAGLAWAALPAAALFSLQLFSETAFTLGIVAFAWLVSRDRGWTDALAGLALGALILTKPMMLLFAAALPFALSKRSSARPTTAILGIAMAPVLAWILRNLLVMGTPALITSAGANLWIGANPWANGGYAEPAPIEGAVSGEVENDRIAGAEALAYIADHPTAWFTLGARKLALLASSEAELVAGVFTRSDTGARLRERYRAVPAWLRASVNMPTLVVLILGVFGLAAAPGGVERPLFGALLFAIAVSSLVFFGGSRFRFPLMPGLVLCAAQFVTGTGRGLKETSRGRLVAAAVACCLIAAIWIVEALTLSAEVS